MAKKNSESTLLNIPIASIDVGLRYRKDFDVSKHNQLADSIKTYGLITPIAVVDKKVLGRFEEGKPRYLLLAGERRLRACVENKYASVDCKVYLTELPDDQIRSIELYENIHREGLTWQEETALKLEIHELEVKLHGKKISTLPDAKGHGVRDTAALLGISVGKASQDLTLAKALITMPELRSAKTKEDAQKQLTKLKRELALEELRKRQESSQAKSPEEKRRKDLIASYIVKDFFEGIKGVPDASIDFVEIDPPYGVDLMSEKRGNENDPSNLDHYNEVQASEYTTFMEETMKEVHRVMKDNSWGVLWFGPEPWFEDMFEILASRGFTVKRLPLIWNKGVGQTQQPNYNLANTYEMAFYFRKGSPTLIKQGRSNVFTYTPVAGVKKYHPTQRPLELMEEVIDTFCQPSARILIPFMGSGLTALAASNKNMSAFGFDLSQVFKNAFTHRVIEGVVGKFID